MIKEAMRYFLDQSKPELVEVDGKTYSNKSLCRVVQTPRADSIKMSTLSSLVEYIKSGIDTMKGKMLVQVVSPTKVVLFSQLDDDRERETVVTVVAQLPDFEFERFMDKEKFNIAMQSKFIDNEDKALMLQFTGTVESGTIAQYSDDGVSQKATIKTGIASKGEALVPNPVHLKPYRTFIEVDQPESDFIFRMKEDKYDDGITCAIFEADGGAWQLEAMANIKKYLIEELKDCGDYTVIS